MDSHSSGNSGRSPLTDEFFREAFDAASDGILVIGADRRYVWANQSAAAIYGLTREELVGRPIGDFTPSRHQGGIEPLWVSATGGKRIEGTYTVQDASGKYHLVEFRTTTVNGHLLCVIRERDGGGAGLSPREREIFGLLGAGLTGAAIATRLHLSPETIRTHIRNAMQKLGARTRAQAIAIAAARGEIEV